MPTRSRTIGKELASSLNAKSSTMCIFFLLAFFCLSASIKAGERTIGHVVELEGDWFLDTKKSKPLSKNQELPAGGVIRIPSPSRFAFIIIRYSVTNETVARRCRNPGECEQPILLPRAIQRQPTFWDYLVEKGMKILQLNQIGPSVHSGRSPHGVLRESVIPIRDGQVDLAPVFAEMNNGSYYVRLQRRMSGSKTAYVSEVTVSWQSGKTITIANLQPGLYEIVLLEKRAGEYTPTLTTAWFLVTNAERYEQTVASFLEATKLTATWKNNVSEGTVRDFLRAILIHLESKPQPAKRGK